VEKWVKFSTRADTLKDSFGLDGFIGLNEARILENLGPDNGCDASVRFSDVRTTWLQTLISPSWYLELDLSQIGDLVVESPRIGHKRKLFFPWKRSKGHKLNLYIKHRKHKIWK
jgi:hypothetical protein